MLAGRNSLKRKRVKNKAERERIRVLPVYIIGLVNTVFSRNDRRGGGSDSFPGGFGGTGAVAGFVAAAAGGKDDSRQGVGINIQEFLSADGTTERKFDGNFFSSGFSNTVGHGSFLLDLVFFLRFTGRFQ